jgi:[ribosomal protein S18]-alanine N-acetyltransferase
MITFNQFLLESKTNIRNFHPSDVPKLLDIDSKAYKYPFHDEDSFDPRYFKIKVHESDNKVNGYVMAYPKPDSSGKDSMYIHSIAVAKDHTGTGVGDALLSHIVQRHQNVHLHVRVSNNKAISLYKKHGFVVKSELPNHYRNGENAFHMEMAK